MKAHEKRNGMLIYRLACLYVMIPIALFLAGWTRWWIALIGIVIIGYCLYTMFRESPGIEFPCFRGHAEIWIAALLIIAVWVYLSGIGRLTFQNADHYWRNTIFDLLVKKSWPVVDAVKTERGTSVFGMVYYIGFWLPSALVGKVFGLNAGYYCQALWAVLGIFLFYYLLCTYLKRVAVWPLIVIVLFSGLDVVGDYLLGSNVLQNGFTSHLEWWNTWMQFSSHTTLLFWVFNQTIPIWLILMLILLQKKNRHIVFLISFSLLSSTLPFIGLIPFMICQGIRNVWHRMDPFLHNIRRIIKETFTIENLVGGGFVGILSFLYLKENTAGQNLAIMIPASFRSWLIIYLLFLFLEAGVFLIGIYRYQKKNVLFWMLIPLFMIFPLIQVGFASDFCMRASIPAILVLCIMVIETLDQAAKKKDLITVMILIVLLAVGSITPLHEISRTIINTSRDEGMNVQVSEDQILGAPNFSCEAEDSFFFHHLSGGWHVETKEAE